MSNCQKAITATNHYSLIHQLVLREYILGAVQYPTFKISSTGCLIFDASSDTIHTVKRSLQYANDCSMKIHYIDLGGILARNFSDFFETKDFFQNKVTKLYASGSHLESIYGIEIFESIQLLYLDGNNISDLDILLQLPRLQSLDIRNNLGDSLEFRNNLISSLPELEWLNGSRIRR
eukprot:gene8762-18127_t